MAEYRLTLVNNTSAPGNLIVYQTFEGGDVPAHTPLAWVSKRAYSGGRATITWNPDDYGYFWSRLGEIGPGIRLEAAQVVPATSHQSEISLSYDAKNRTFFLHDAKASERASRFFIRTDDTIPSDPGLTTGLTLAGEPVLGFGAVANLHIAMSFGRAQYHVTFGDVEQAAFFDLASVVEPVTLDFQQDGVSLTATLNADKSWNVRRNIMLEGEETE